MKKYTVGVIGLGYVGMPLMLRCIENGFYTVGFDVNDELINDLNAGKSHLIDIPSSTLMKTFSQNSPKLTSDPSHLAACDNIIICVPTPIDTQNQPDLTFLRQAIETVLEVSRENQMICIESTTYPGSTRELLVERALSYGYRIGENLYVGFSPERINPGTKNYDDFTIPKVVAGASEQCLNMVEDFYKKLYENVVRTSSLEVAEMSKLLENTYRFVNISLINQIKKFTTEIGIDIFEVVDAAKTKPFGFQPFYPGLGAGGHCIPVDPNYLTMSADHKDINLTLIKETTRINSEIIGETAERIKNSCYALLLNKKPKVLLHGLSYKSGVSDYRESPAVKLAHALLEMDVELSCYNPMGDAPDLLKSISVDEPMYSDFDAIVLAVEDKNTNYKNLLKTNVLIFDSIGKFPISTRNVVRI